jgi:hypothetical protein
MVCLRNISVDTLHKGDTENSNNDNNKITPEIETRAEHTAAEHAAAEHTAAEHTAAEHTAAEHTAAEHTAAEHTAAEHTALIVPVTAPK